MTDMVSQTSRIYHVEQLCRVVLAISQGRTIFDLPPASTTLAEVPGQLSQTQAKSGFKVTEGLFTSAIAEGRIAAWLFNPEDGMNY